MSVKLLTKFGIMTCLPNWARLVLRERFSTLSEIGVEGTFFNTIRSYLTGRKQVVVVDGVKSDTLKVHAGMP